jgi:hypothetical protein
MHLVIDGKEELLEADEVNTTTLPVGFHNNFLRKSSLSLGLLLETMR